MNRHASREAILRTLRHECRRLTLAGLSRDSGLSLSETRLTARRMRRDGEVRMSRGQWWLHEDMPRSDMSPAWAPRPKAPGVDLRTRYAEDPLCQAIVEECGPVSAETIADLCGVSATYVRALVRQAARKVAASQALRDYAEAS